MHFRKRNELKQNVLLSQECDLVGDELFSSQNSDAELGRISEADPPSEKADKKPNGEIDEDAEEIITWTEFTQNTTFHGLKYIFDEKPFGLRRQVELLAKFPSGFIPETSKMLSENILKTPCLI